MSEENQQIIIDYPDDFPISGPLRAVFTERLKTFFEGCNTWSCSSEGSLPEKLLKLRLKMQKNIGYPPSKPSAPESDEGGELGNGKETVVLPEELLSWEGLQTKSMEGLSPIVRNAGLEMASRILGLQIRYGTAIHNDEGQPGFIPQTLCPFTRPGVISNLTKDWSPADRARLRRQIEKHTGIAATIALIVGMVLGGVLTPSGTVVITPPGYHHDTYAERSYSAPHPQGLLQPAERPAPQPSPSAPIARPLPSIAPSQIGIAPQDIPSIQQGKQGN